MVFKKILVALDPTIQSDKVIIHALEPAQRDYGFRNFDNFQLRCLMCWRLDLNSA